MRVTLVEEDFSFTTEWCRILERQLAFSLRRFGAALAEVEVRMGRGPGDAPNTYCYRCRVQATLIPRGRVTVEVADADCEAAIGRAMRRASRGVERELLSK
ncbi:MAG: hypothetical protein RBU21_09230 [FCB group bacterium]|jgi:hypothetical protein|nr:hypothetical protein [FCB group bacterium]